MLAALIALALALGLHIISNSWNHRRDHAFYLLLSRHITRYSHSAGYKRLVWLLHGSLRFRTLLLKLWLNGLTRCGYCCTAQK